MQRNSNSDTDGYPIQTTSLKLGKLGLDLRTDDTTLGSLVDLRNGRFSDEEIVERRTGHSGKILQDQDQFIVGNGTIGNWVYGHGQAIVGNGIYSPFHYPISRQHLYTFNYNGNDVSWTGDRLVVHSAVQGACLGQSAFWNTYSSGSTPTKRGIPCFLPSLVDKTPPLKVTGTTNNSCDTAILGNYRCVAYLNNGVTTVQIVDTNTNELISTQAIATSTSNNSNLRVIVSAGAFVVYWTDLTSGNLYNAAWNGVVWTSETNVVAVDAYDIATPGEDTYYLFYRQGTSIKARAYINRQTQITPFAIDTVVLTSATLAGPIGATVAKSGNVCIVYFNTGVGCSAGVYTSRLANLDSDLVEPTTGALDAIAVCPRLFGSLGNETFQIYLGYSGGVGVKCVRAIEYSSFPGSGYTSTTGAIKWGCTLLSRTFSVDNAAFVWLKSGNTNLNFLITGNRFLRVCGYADRGEAAAPFTSSNRTLPNVGALQSTGYDFTWARPITATVSQANHLRYSDIDFLPQITSAQYGQSVYLSGSAVLNFDGSDCSDAGFHEYPIVTGGVAAASGSLSAGAYSIRAYLVRYNNKGEKFTSPALTSTSVTATASQKITWTIRTVQSCNASDAFIEVYRTAAGGTTYNLEGTVANDQTQDTVTFVSTLADTAIASAVGDSFQPQIGGLAELQNWGPIGSTILLAANDRIWGAGGQVPFGRVMFSKLKSDGFGAGFDAIGGFATVDSQGGALTSIGGMGNQMILFEEDKFFVMDGSEGPNNYGQGGFPAAKYAAAKGATTHFGTLLTDAGLVYWNEAGPHLIGSQFSVNNISDPIRPLARTLTPTGVRLNPNKQEVIWYTNTGTALLWDYKYQSRWCLWDNLFINAASETALASADGELLIEDESLYTDAGSHYTFRLKTNPLRLEDMMQGHCILHRYGMTGTYLGEHNVYARIYYNGSPLWEECELWEPEANTYLQPASAFGDLTADQVDALSVLDKSGNYSFHRRPYRQDCQRFQVELFDDAPDGPSFIPQTLEFELGVKPGFGRHTVQSFTDK